MKGRRAMALHDIEGGPAGAAAFEPSPRRLHVAGFDTALGAGQ
jgi:hypothetical protein